MKQTFKGILTKADDTIRLKYLLAKNDVDDIQTASVILYEHLKDELPKANIELFVGKIEITCQSKRFFTNIIINLSEEQLSLRHNEHEGLELFNQKSECDPELVRKVKRIIEGLGFYKGSEFKTSMYNFQWHNEIYKIDVIRRKL